MERVQMGNLFSSFSVLAEAEARRWQRRPRAQLLFIVLGLGGGLFRFVT